MQKHIIVRDTLIYSGASYIAIFVGFFVSVFSKRFFGVSGAGYWAILTVATTYGMYIGLGVQSALIREVPQRIGAKEIEKAKAIENVTYSFLLIAGLAGAIVMWLISFFLFADPL